MNSTSFGVQHRRLLSAWLVEAGLAWLLMVASEPVVWAADTTPPATASSAPAVMMRPFSVMAEWMEIQPVMRKGVIEYVRIAHVQPTSPAAAAGLKVGMQVVELQGIVLPGLPEAEFAARLQALPPAPQLSVKVRGITTTRATVLAVPLSPANVRPGTPAPGAGEDNKVDAIRPATTAETLQQIAAAERAVQAESTRMSAEAREKGRSASDPYLMEQISRELALTPPAHLALLCEAASKAGNAGRMLRGALLNAVNRRTDYEPAQREVILKYLPKLPELVFALEKMNWLDGAEAGVAQGWKKVVEEESDAGMNSRVSRYARLAARRGVLDALVAIATAARAPGTSRRNTAASLATRLAADEAATLKSVLGLETSDAKELADYVLKNKRRLVFDAGRGVYVLKPQ